jgi:hypothetical protein
MIKLNFKVIVTAATIALALGALTPTALAEEPVKCSQIVSDGTLIWRFETLQSARDAVKRRDESVMPAYKALIADADAALKRGPFSVMEKTKTPPSGDKHDYMSIGPYWWPDPQSKTGLPYIQRDGERNPESTGDAFDRTRMQKMTSDVTTLALAAYFSGEKDYALHAQRLLAVWFVDSGTRMNPNLKFGQAIPGKTDGRGIGIIDTSNFTDLVDAVILLRREKLIDDRVFVGVRQWFQHYASWLATDPIGLEERAEENNHGTFYDMQLATYALFVGDCDLAGKIFEDTDHEHRPNAA